MRGCVFLTTALLFSAGCAEPGPKVVPVRGSVKLNEKPLAEGVVVFAVNGEVPREMRIRDGLFEGQALVGTNRIQFAVYEPPPPHKGPPPPPGMEPSSRNILPPQYHQESTISKEVTPNGPNQFDFELVVPR